MCGVCEYITPIKYNSEFLGYISIGGYRGNRDCCTLYANKNNISSDTLEQKYDTYLKSEKPDEKILQTLTKPLASMLATAFMQDIDVDDESDDSLYKHILSVIHAGAFSKLSIEDISNACHCNQSTLSHLLKKDPAQQ